MKKIFYALMCAGTLSFATPVAAAVEVPLAAISPAGMARRVQERRERRGQIRHRVRRLRHRRRVLQRRVARVHSRLRKK